jgi:hypothetical protein|tara:strand:- start:38 stop:385 length:348 start_codon:yes stop_codon:yes gene_type:complete
MKLVIRRLNKTEDDVIESVSYGYILEKEVDGKIYRVKRYAVIPLPAPAPDKIIQYDNIDEETVKGWVVEALLADSWPSPPENPTGAGMNGLEYIEYSLNKEMDKKVAGKKLPWSQ